MAYKQCVIINQTDGWVTLCGHNINAHGNYEVPDTERPQWGSDDDVLVAICDDTIVINDGQDNIVGYNAQIDWLKGY